MRRLPVLAVLVGLAALPAPAMAARVTLDGGFDSLTYKAGLGETNRVTLTQTSDGWRFDDPGVLSISVTLNGGSGSCFAAGSSVTCSDVPAGYALKLDVQDGDDEATVDPAITDDVKLDGGDGHDVLAGGAGGDNLIGGAGNDLLRGRAGADKLDGYAGADAVDYGERTAGVVVTPGTGADDGAAGEGDDVGADVEAATGGAGDDELTAGAGGGRLVGGAGADRLVGAAGVDAFAAGDGDDEVLSDDGLAEQVACGAGADTADADSLDAVAADCEETSDPDGGDPADGDPADGGDPGSSDPGGAPAPSGGTPADPGDRAATATEPKPAAAEERPGADPILPHEFGKLPEDPAPVLGDLPRPAPGRSVNAATALGTVLVTRPGGRPTPLDDDAALPVGALVDARKGAITLTAAADEQGRVQSATFEGASFRIRQARGARPVTELVLVGGSFARCPRPSRATARAAAKRKPVRSLWGRGKGRFRTRGRFAAATVRGTIWLTEDTCDATRVQVRRGVVEVRDRLRNRKVLVRAGRSTTIRRR